MALKQIMIDELTNDPEARGYAGMTDAQAATDLSEQRYTQNRPIPINELLAFSDIENLSVTITEASISLNTKVATAAKTFDRLYQQPYEALDLEQKPLKGAVVGTGRQMIDDLLANALIDATQHAAILAMATQPVSRAEILGLRYPVQPGHVAEARG